MEKQNKKMKEVVMVFPAGLLRELGYFQGISFEAEKFYDKIINQRNFEFLNRENAEQNPDFKQIIPYVILKHGEKIFTYRRGKLMTEKRLLGQYSLGIGGHITIDDPQMLLDTYEYGLQREIDEEVDIACEYEKEFVAMINDDSNEVGQVHFGFVHVLNLKEPLVKPREKSINEPKFQTIVELKKNMEKFETWSQICIQAMDKIIRHQ